MWKGAQMKKNKGVSYILVPECMVPLSIVSYDY